MKKVLDLNNIIPDKREVKIKDKVFDVSQIPVYVTLQADVLLTQQEGLIDDQTELQKLTQEYLDALRNKKSTDGYEDKISALTSKVKADAQSQFEQSLDLALSVAEHCGTPVDKDWLLKNTNIEQLRAFLQFATRHAVDVSDDGVITTVQDDGDKKKATK